MVDRRVHAKIVGAYDNAPDPGTHLRRSTRTRFHGCLRMRSLIRQLSWFIAVGCAAAATHWLVVVACVEAMDARPLLANVLGWLVAFCVSFSGHYLLTFRHQAGAWHVAAVRFFCISAGGFAINELTYAWLLHRTALRYDVLLALVLLAIAVLTFLFSRFWAFRRNAAT
ncbi:sugar translocase [Bordetella flabilis]|uniref:Sugar translocase n=1 Tax=Bordetella flabilis TaxID=463014 RepID=A0A193GM76_9BORD|nr:sugar translocase [Bordetella flabilis]